MNGNGVKHREAIISLLKSHSEGLTITSIASLSGLHRHTVTKYMYELHGADIVVERVIGPAKLFYLREGLSNSQKNNIMGRLNGSKKSSLGQMQILAVLLFLFLVPTTIIIAQNATNYTDSEFGISGDMVAMNDGITGEINFSDLLMNMTNSTNITNGTGLNGSYEILPIEPIITNTTNETQGNDSAGNFTIPDMNETYPWNESDLNYTEPSNETNITLPINETIPVNETLPSNETNETVPNETIVIPEPPILEISIDSLDRLTRGETFQAIGRVVSRGLLPVRNVRIEWSLPDDFGIISGELTKECDDLSKDEECVSVIEVSTTIDNEIGEEELEVLAYYG